MDLKKHPNIQYIMLIDDDPITNIINERNLMALGYDFKIDKFNSGRSAIDFLKNRLKTNELMPNIIFLDINMPMMNGWDFMKEYQALKSDVVSNIRLFMLTSSSAEQDLQKVKQFPEIEKYLVKPLSDEAINRILVMS
ncbi:MAG: response regulator [Flammeovirgaceae bacterium]